MQVVQLAEAAIVDEWVDVLTETDMLTSRRITRCGAVVYVAVVASLRTLDYFQSSYFRITSLHT